MVSHVVIIWAKDPSKDVEIILDGAAKLLEDIPGVEAFHAGQMYPTDRPVVDKTYHVALNMQFQSMEDLATYQKHPKHVEFVENYLKPNLEKLLVYDFNSWGFFVEGKLYLVGKNMSYSI